MSHLKQSRSTIEPRPREFSGSILVIEDREASLVAKYAFAEPRDWATASQAMRATESAPAVT
jgi:hypothetical protein